MPDRYAPSTMGTFIRPCLTCGQTLHVVNGETPPHDCDPHVESIIARAWWAGWDAAEAQGRQDAEALARRTIANPDIREAADRLAADGVNVGVGGHIEWDPSQVCDAAHSEDGAE